MPVLTDGNRVAGSEASAVPDLARLQGVWTAVAGRRKARLMIAGSHYTFRFLGGETYVGTLRLNADATPRQMDMHIEDGPAAYQGLSSLCIYDLDGDTLRWCPTVPGAGYRLTRFPSVEDDHYYCLVFRRESQA